MRDTTSPKPTAAVIFCVLAAVLFAAICIFAVGLIQFRLTPITPPEAETPGEAVGGAIGAGVGMAMVMVIYIVLMIGVTVPFVILDALAITFSARLWRYGEGRCRVCGIVLTVLSSLFFVTAAVLEILALALPAAGA